MWTLLGLIACAPDPAPPPTPVATEVAAPVTDKHAIEAKRKALFATIRDFVGELEAAGRYDCCVKIPCTHCAVLAAGCACGEGLRRGEPVCEECAYLWMHGQGAEPGVSPESVRSFLEASRAMSSKPPAPSDPCACEHDKKDVTPRGADPATGAGSGG